VKILETRVLLGLDEGHRHVRSLAAKKVGVEEAWHEEFAAPRVG
jgi:hypothetical protein